MGLATPKQLLKIAGRTILEHALLAFETAPEVDEVVVMMNPGFIADAEKIVREAGLRKVTRVLPGGTSRNATTQLVLDALAHLPAERTKLLVHDAVRPLVSHEIIAESVRALDTYEAVDVAIPSADTIVEVDEDVIVDVPDRSRLRRGQTPQSFRMHVLAEAYTRAWQDPDFAATDDCSVVLRYRPETPIYVVAGSERNMKVTEPLDMFLADKLFQLSSATALGRTPQEYSRHFDGTTTVVFGGSSGIGAGVADLIEKHGGRVFRYSRSTTRTDVGKAEDCEAALAQAYAATGRIDHVINSAGVLNIGRLDQVSPEEIEESVRVNYLAQVFIARAAHPYLCRSSGHLLFYTSSSYTRGRASYSLYSSAKAGTVNLTQALADEWAGDGVHINCINPERTRTPMRLKAFGDEPVGTLLSSDQVARASLDVLLSDLTGQVIDVRREDPGGPSRGSAT
jgi:ribitol-5-phosphate 2-dehydrogenase (NADP+) / D-ribitol-5-phosphate cytidylyltransferase